ncbi:CPBP family intramembrane glutamic endopeptidase [Alisedimentitalea sp. MJ-SS2]|uniref:CPBP family intramembrane glutamic endopeptidase n=1 Tax=Aliisedimentitalea sp. MJ-SS2 TaxID=3049795 RepID=UPI0029147908|nr:CPBP family intramembrane glutamic endopeptidase [Alisedimentitalea sp. MJ-SS2]MDU8929401.1 CPBP family intramembrane glutamic endopeptidase [Alisedimentitalea sp. MJ-SS2]
MRYAAHDVLIEPARPSAQLWRLVLGAALIVACFFAMGYSYFNILAEIVTEDHWPSLADEIDHGSTPRGMIAILGIFGLLTLSLLVVINVLHQRRLRSLFGPPAKAAQDFTRVMVALCALGTLLWLLPEPEAMTPTPGLPILRWLSLLPVSLILVMLQISAEELAFRGYLQSQLAARFNHPLVWITLPALIFGILHYDVETAGANAPVMALSAFVFGLAAADLTARSGTLGPALALHFAINVSALLITASMGRNFGLALQIYPFTLDDTVARATWLPYDFLMLLCAWLAARLAITR